MHRGSRQHSNTHTHANTHAQGHRPQHSHPYLFLSVTHTDSHSKPRTDLHIYTHIGETHSRGVHPPHTNRFEQWLHWQRHGLCSLHASIATLPQCWVGGAGCLVDLSGMPVHTSLRYLWRYNLHQGRVLEGRCLNPHGPSFQSKPPPGGGQHLQKVAHGLSWDERRGCAEDAGPRGAGVR